MNFLPKKIFLSGGLSLLLVCVLLCFSISAAPSPTYPTAPESVCAAGSDANQYAPLWSPDEKKFAYREWNRESAMLKICNVENKSALALFGEPDDALARILGKSGTQSIPAIASFAWAPDGDHFAFVRYDKNDMAQNGIFIGVAGEKLNLSVSPVQQDVAVSKINWAGRDHGNSAIIYISKDDIKILSFNKAYDKEKTVSAYSSGNRKSDPAFSHDAKRIIWSEDTSSGPKLFTCDLGPDLTCLKPQQITYDNNPSKDFCPSFSPDDRYISFFSTRDVSTPSEGEGTDVFSLSVLRMADGKMIRGTPHRVRASQALETCPSWSDLNKIVYLASQPGENYPIYETEIEEGKDNLKIKKISLFKPFDDYGLKVLIKEPTVVNDFSLSPSGKAILFSHANPRHNSRTEVAWIDLKPFLAREKTIDKVISQERLIEPLSQPSGKIKAATDLPKLAMPPQTERPEGQTAALQAEDHPVRPEPVKEVARSTSLTPVAAKPPIITTKRESSASVSPAQSKGAEDYLNQVYSFSIHYVGCDKGADSPEYKASEIRIPIIKTRKLLQQTSQNIASYRKCEAGGSVAWLFAPETTKYNFTVVQTTNAQEELAFRIDFNKGAPSNSGCGTVESGTVNQEKPLDAIFAQANLDTSTTLHLLIKQEGGNMCDDAKAKKTLLGLLVAQNKNKALKHSLLRLLNNDPDIWRLSFENQAAEPLR